MTCSSAAHAAVSVGDVGVAKKKLESAAEEEEASKRREAEEQETRKREEGAAAKQKEEEVVEARARAAVMLHVCVRACMWVGGWWCGGFYL